VEFAQWERTERQVFEAARVGNVVLLKSQLAKGTDVNWHNPVRAVVSLAQSPPRFMTHAPPPVSQDANLYTAVCVAAEFGHVDVVRILIDEGADVNVAQVPPRASRPPICSTMLTPCRLQLDRMSPLALATFWRWLPFWWVAEGCLPHRKALCAVALLNGGASVADAVLHPFVLVDPLQPAVIGLLSLLSWKMPLRQRVAATLLLALSAAAILWLLGQFGVEGIPSLQF